MAEGRTPRSARIAIWVGAAAAVAIAAFGVAAVLRGGGDEEARCAETGGVWNFEQQVCAPPHGGDSARR